MRTISLQPSLCIGCGSCVDIMPAYFSFNDSGRAQLFGAAPAGDSEATVIFPDDEVAAREVVAVCPSKCIALI